MRAVIVRFNLSIFLSVLLAFSCSIGSSPSAFAQGTSATLTGTIVDPAGALLANTAVTLTNTGTNFSRTSQSNASGTYTLADLPPGHYTLTVEQQGFKKYVQSGIELTVNEHATQNIALQVGDTAVSVEVTSNAELINTSSAEISSVVDATAVTQLPLNGRDPSSLVLLSPGTTNVLNTGGGYLQSGFSFPTETGASANGGRQGSTYYLLDGVPNMDSYLQLAAPFPNADATQEFRVITNNFDAHYGFSPGAVVSIQTRSGENRFHGGAFEFLRNNDFNAGNYFTHAVDTLKRNQFGGEIGGPILKNKLFFFFNYQGTRSTASGSTNVAYTPTAAMLAGDFSAVPATLTGPFKTVAGIPNQVDPALFSPASVTITKTGLPLGQVPSTGQVNYQTGNIINNFNEYTGRIDYNISASQRLSVRTFEDFFRQPSGDINGNLLSVLILPAYIQIMNEPMNYYNEVINHSWTISPKMVNVISGFWTQMGAHSSAAVNDSSGQPICLSRYIKVNELPGQCYLEGLSVTNGFSSGYTEPSQEIRTNIGILETLTRTIGNHTLSVGVDVFHQYAKQITQYPTQPTVAFYGGYTGSGLADFLLGDVGGFTQGAGLIQGTNGWQVGPYIQDQYKFRPNITITAGLRWDPNLPPQTAGGQGAAFHPGQQSTVFTNAPEGLVFPGDKGVNASLMPTSYGYFEPRVGIAWQPSWLKSTSVRAGFGLFDAPLPYSAYGHTPEVTPFSPTYTFYGSPSSPINFQDPYANFAGTNFTSPFPPFLSLANKPAANSAFPGPVSVPAIFSNDFKLGITQSWNASIEQQFGANLALHLAYVGSESYHQTTVIDQNPGIFASGGARTTYPAFAQILTDFSNGTASYNSLQVGLEQRLSHNIQFQSNFTWSKTIDLASSGNISFGAPQLANPFNLRFNRGISYLNVPHISVTNFIYTTPELRGHGELMRSVFGAWQASGIVTIQSGSPFTISGGTGNNSEALQYGDRADVVPGQQLNVHQGGKGHWLNNYLNAAAFTVNAPGTFGNSGKNELTGPAVATADLGVAKNWMIRETVNLQFRWEAFNAFNHPSFGTPNNNPTASNFGQITAIGAVPPRVMQGALKLTF
jgi:Carboxypeptidase regulatory-like domain